MKPPQISEIRVKDEGFFVVIDNTEVKIVTFREGLWMQSKIMLPPPWDADCPPTTILSDANDEDSDLKEIDGCLHDPWAAGLMKQWAADKLANGTYRRI